MKKSTYPIGELSRLSGVKIPTIRFYEETGLLPAAPRNAGNRREYDDDALERLRFIRHSRELGFATEDIRELLQLSSRPSRSCRRVDQIARRHLQAVERRLAQLTALREELVHMIDHCQHGTIRKCEIIHILANHAECLHSDHSAG